MADAHADRSVLTLAIETSNPNAGGEPGVALGRTCRNTRSAPGDAVAEVVAEVLGVESLGAGERHDDLLMPAIDRLLARCGRSPREIDRIVVSAGPGGYTGLRIATSAANMIALAVGSPVVAVPSAAVVARGMSDRGPLAVCLASKHESAWVTRFEADGAMMGTGALQTAGELGLKPGETLVGDRFLPETFREAAAAAGCAVEPPVFDPRACLDLAWSYPACEAGGAHPLYGREAEAVTRWRELHGGG